MSNDLAGRSAVVTGATDTPMLRNAMERRGRNADDVAGRLSYIERFGDPDEIAKAAVWRCSDASSFTTGHALAVDGGMLAG
jgi:NAD(P)-dependent dehydrogenase (short-subunit alcohol dehydrogenase family)